MTVFGVNPKESTNKLLELISEFSKVPGWNGNKKSVVFLYAITSKERNVKLIPSIKSLKKSNP